MLENYTDAERIVLFLDRNDNRSWEAESVADRVDLDTNTVKTILSELEDRNIVCYERPYWKITDDEERLCAAYRIHGYHKNADAQYGEERLKELRTDELEEVS